MCRVTTFTMFEASIVHGWLNNSIGRYSTGSNIAIQKPKRCIIEPIRAVPELRIHRSPSKTGLPRAEAMGYSGTTGLPT